MLAPAVGPGRHEDITLPVQSYTGTTGEQDHPHLKRIALHQSMNPSSPLRSLLIASDETPWHCQKRLQLPSSPPAASCKSVIASGRGKRAFSLNSAGHGLQPFCLLPQGKIILTP